MGGCSNKSQITNIASNKLDLSASIARQDEDSARIAAGNRKVEKHKPAIFDSRRGSSNTYIEAATAEVSEIPKTPKEIELIRNSLAKHFIFTKLNENYISIIIHHMKLYNLKNSELIFEQGQPGNNFYVVSKGKLEVVVNSKRIKLLSSGDSFGEVALLHNTPRTASVYTITNCSLWCVDRKTFRRTVEALESMNYEENQKFINTIPIFETLTLAQKDTVLHSLTSHYFSPGSPIVNEGDPGDLLYIIKEGIVLVTKNNQEVRKMTKGFFFGEQALLHSSLRTASVTAIDNVKCVAISGHQLTKIFGSQLLNVISTNSIRISIEKNHFLQKLTKVQLELLIPSMKINNYQDQEIVVPEGTNCKDFSFIIIRGALSTSNSKTKIGKIFDIVHAENMIKNVDLVYDENIVAAGETTLASISKLEFETKLGGSFEQITSNNDIFKVIKRIQILRGLDNNSIQAIMQALKVAEFEDGSTVVEQNDPGDSFFIIKSGKATVYKDGSTIRTITKHDYFGERSLLFNDFRSASVKAKGHLVC